MNQLSLKSLEAMLTEAGYDSIHIEGEGEEIRDFLQVFLGTDEESRERTLQISLAEDWIDLGGASSSSESQLLKVEFYAPIIVELDDLAAEQLSSLLHFINRMIDLPGFLFDETEGRVAYRFVHLTESSVKDFRLIQVMVGAIKMFLELFGGVIGEVAQGKKTFDDILDVLVGHLGSLETGEET